VTLLVAAQIVAYSTGDLAGRVRVGLIELLSCFVGGSDHTRLLIGPFDVGIGFV
jgi:hypothetical protein